jgi:hypothetical protein
MIVRHTHQTSVRYLIPSTKRDLAQWQLDAATEQFYELATQEANRPILDTLNEITRSPEEMHRRSPTLIHDSGWKDVSND